MLEQINLKLRPFNESQTVSHMRMTVHMRNKQVCVYVCKFDHLHI